MADRDLHGLACPNCGSPVPIPEGHTIVICPSCDMRSLVQGDRGIHRYQVPRKVERQQAISQLEQFLSGKMQIARNAAKTHTVQETFVVYLPFWAKWARVLGWVFGEEEVGSGDDKRYEPREVKIAEEMSWNGVALDVGEFGVQEIKLHGRELDAFTPDELHASGMVFEPVGSISDANAAADQDFNQRVKRLANLDRTSQTFIRTAKQRLGLVYYPLWVVRYAYRGRSFQVVVDGYDGTLLYGKAPGSTMFRALALVAGMALGAFALVDGTSLAVYLAFASGDDDAFAAFGALALAALGGGALLMGWGYRSFRYGEHYEYRGASKTKRRVRRKNIDGVQRVVEELT